MVVAKQAFNTFTAQLWPLRSVPLHSAVSHTATTLKVFGVLGMLPLAIYFMGEAKAMAALKGEPGLQDVLGKPLVISRPSLQSCGPCMIWPEALWC